MTLKAILNELTPPLIKKLITISKRNFQKESKPEWIHFKDGPLCNLKFLIKPESNLGMLFLNGHDDFIYKELENYYSIKNPVFYDIGAHFGFHTLGFSKYAGENGKVYAFEPHPLNKDRLKQNLEANQETCKNITVIEKAITDYKGTATFEMITDIESGWSATSKLVEGQENKDIPRIMNLITVETDTIDNLISQREIIKPDVIKIDVEGGEFKVLKGGLNTLKEFKPIIFIEVHTIECMYLTQQLLYEINYELKLLYKEDDGRCFIMATANSNE